jgi:hypothetical protein
MNKVPENNSEYIYSNKMLAPFERSHHRLKKSLENINKVELTHSPSNQLTRSL